MNTEENKKKREITLHNVLSFLEGNTKFYMDKFGMYPPHLQEQVLWRLNVCKSDCVKNGACEYCGCSPMKKAYVKESCNHGDRFPDMMDEEKWKQYKIDNKLYIDTDGNGL